MPGWNVARKEQPHRWKVEPDEHDFPAAEDFLSLLFPESVAAALVLELRGASTVYRRAKDLVRASGLPLLPVDNPHVAADLKKLAKGRLLSPVLLVRGRGEDGVALIVADGYHRVSASYVLDEDADIPCRLVDLPPAAA
jgi:hypothetical protein